MQLVLIHVLLLVDGSHLSVDSEEGCSCCAVDVSGVGLSCCDVEVVECGRRLSHISVGRAEHVVGPHSELPVSVRGYAVPSVVVGDEPLGSGVACEERVGSVQCFQAFQFAEHSLAFAHAAGEQRQGDGEDECDVG